MEIARLEPFQAVPVGTKKRAFDMMDQAEPRSVPDTFEKCDKEDLRRQAIMNESHDCEEIESQNVVQGPIQIDPSTGLQVPTLRATSVIPSLSLMYADTAPRQIWRPQMESWMKKSGRRIRDVERAVDAYDKLDSHKYVIPEVPQKKQRHNSDSVVATTSSLVDHAVNIDPIISPNPIEPKLKPPQSPLQLPPPNMASPKPSPHMEIATLTSPNKSYSSPSYGSSKRRCISCGSDQSPCWRPSWSASAGQLCNSCGLRYKKTGARCTEPDCGRIPAKGEWAVMRNTAKRDPLTGRMSYACIYCRGVVEVNERY